jgi:hypothetical protein
MKGSRNRVFQGSRETWVTKSSTIRRVSLGS